MNLISAHVRAWPLALGAAFWLAACLGAAPTPLPTAAPVSPVVGLPGGTDGYAWWNDSIFYEIFVRSFYDSDGDGIGDLPGLIAKLDYLNDGDPATTTDLGISGLWLMPIHPAASYHGYDVIDYYNVNPDYGTLDDVRRLLAEAHRRGIRVIIDWVPNHTSSQHPWFQAAQDPQSDYRAWYVWSESEPATLRGWHRTARGDYYYGFFWEGMPDLNYTHPPVTEQMREVARFWLQEVGVDGFRIDAIKYLIEDGELIEHTEATFGWLRDFRPFYQSINPQALTVGEIWDSSLRVDDYTAGDGLDLAFDFDLAHAFEASATIRRANQATVILKRDLELFRPNQFAIFLTNHDQNRIMSTLRDDVGRAKTAAAMLLTSPGVPFLYYGEEIGLLGEKPDEDIRRPMQWSAEAHGGFSTAVSVWRPVHADYLTKNVAAQTDDPDSLLAFYRRLIHLRNDHAALRVGETWVVEASDPALYTIVRASQAETILVLLNLKTEAVSDYSLTLSAGPLAASRDVSAIPLLGAGPFAPLTANAAGGFDAYRPLPELPPQSLILLQLNPKP